MLIQHLDAEADAFFGGEGVDVAADRVDLPRNIFGGAVLSPFEDHMLDEMRNAIPLLVFVAGSGLNPDSDRDRTDVLHLLGDYGEPVGEHLTPDVSAFIHLSYSHTIHGVSAECA